MQWLLVKGSLISRLQRLDKSIFKHPPKSMVITDDGLELNKGYSVPENNSLTKKDHPEILNNSLTKKDHPGVFNREDSISKFKSFKNKATVYSIAEQRADQRQRNYFEKCRRKEHAKLFMDLACQFDLPTSELEKMRKQHILSYGVKTIESEKKTALELTALHLELKRKKRVLLGHLRRLLRNSRDMPAWKKKEVQTLIDDVSEKKNRKKEKSQSVEKPAMIDCLVRIPMQGILRKKPSTSSRSLLKPRVVEEVIDLAESDNEQEEKRDSTIVLSDDDEAEPSKSQDISSNPPRKRQRMLIPMLKRPMDPVFINFGTTPNIGVEETISLYPAVNSNTALEEERLLESSNNSASVQPTSLPEIINKDTIDEQKKDTIDTIEKIVPVVEVDSDSNDSSDECEDGLKIVSDSEESLSALPDSCSRTNPIPSEYLEKRFLQRLSSKIGLQKINSSTQDQKKINIKLSPGPFALNAFTPITSFAENSQDYSALVVVKNDQSVLPKTEIPQENSQSLKLDSCNSQSNNVQTPPLLRKFSFPTMKTGGSPKVFKLKKVTPIGKVVPNNRFSFIQNQLLLTKTNNGNLRVAVRPQPPVVLRTPNVAGSLETHQAREEMVTLHHPSEGISETRSVQIPSFSQFKKTETPLVIKKPVFDTTNFKFILPKR